MQKIMSLIEFACDVVRALYPIAKDVYLARQKLKAEKRANVSQPDKQG